MTKTRSTAELEEPQAKHQSRPVDERVAAAAAPPLLGYSIQEFCTAVGISLSFFYELKQAGLAPRAMPDARASEWIFDKFAPAREHATMRQLIPSYHRQLVSAARSSRL